MAPKNFMTAKEKDYVAECLRRNMRYFRSDIDYASLLDPRQGKIEMRCDDGEPRRSINLVFGKESRKSARRPRPFCGADVQSTKEPLRSMFLVDELIDLYTVRRYCKLSDEDLKENIGLLRSRLLSGFDMYISTTKLLRFLGEYLPFVEEDERKEIMALLQKTFHLVKDVDEFYSSIGALISAMPETSEAELEAGFVSTFLFFPSGVILATSLLIRNEGLCDVFYRTVLAEPSWPFTRGRYGWQLLSVMISMVDEEKQKSIVKRAKPYLLEIARSPSKGEIDSARVFLDTIGVRMEDLIGRSG
ncbi:hypothetical protein M970_110940 [Encephalitozoon cuniculi EcunIII-L]|nr:hypothetical protein M970_110940 [Encephalitozoon cuniculi EcunIII-L]